VPPGPEAAALSPAGDPGYARRLGVFDAAMLTVGGIIGGGIFLNPSVVAERVHTAPLILFVWIAGGIIAIAGALTFAELGGRRPEAGGGYVYLREAFGPLPAFLYGWTFVLIINTGGMAAVAVTFARYTVDLAGAGTAAVRPVAVATILLLTVVNCFGIRVGATTVNVFTILKLAALVAVVGAGVAVGLAHGHPSTIATPAPTGPATTGALVRTIGVALIPVLFSYGGWAHANNVAGEMRDPMRTLPRAMTLGILIVVATYLAANVAYLEALGPSGLAASQAPASDTMRNAVGSLGRTLIDLGIAASTFGFVNLTILSAPRILQTMAADGLFFTSAARLHPRYRTPTLALIVQGAWAIIFTASGTYGQLLDYTVFGDWIFFGLIATTIFVYRARDRRASGVVVPFRVPGFPVVPVAFVIVAAFVVASSILSNPRNAALGFCLILAGVPAFWVWRRRHAARLHGAS
jgi:APA family basic amino acid/polyamine antiporter